MTENDSRNCRGYSTMVDAMAFLVLVSVAGMMLAPVIFPPCSSVNTADKEQVASAVLLGLVDARVGEFNYSMVPAFVSDYVHDMGGKLDSSELLSNVVNSLFSHHLLHRTYADLLCDFAASQFYLDMGAGAELNFMTSSYRIELENKLDEYFIGVLGPGWDWRLQIAWEPFSGLALGSYAAFGSPQPGAAWCSEIDVSMPYFESVTMEEVLAVLEPHAGCIAVSKTSEGVENHVRDAFKALLDDVLNATVMTGFQALFEWAEGFSGASRLLRLNESLMSGSEIDGVLEYEFTIVDGDESEDLTLELDGMRDFLCSVVMNGNEQFLKDYSTMLHVFLESGEPDEEEVLKNLYGTLYGRFSLNSARLSIQLWEVKAPG